jgi:hypothetical protein
MSGEVYSLQQTELNLDDNRLAGPGIESAIGCGMQCLWAEHQMPADTTSNDRHCEEQPKQSSQTRLGHLNWIAATSGLAMTSVVIARSALSL